MDRWLDLCCFEPSIRGLTIFIEGQRKALSQHECKLKPPTCYAAANRSAYNGSDAANNILRGELLKLNARGWEGLQWQVADERADWRGFYSTDVRKYRGFRRCRNILTAAWLSVKWVPDQRDRCPYRPG